jgi:hypothetical protein
MAHRKQWLYVAKFVVACWTAVAGLAAIVVGIFYLSRENATLTIIASQLVIYSGAFAFMGWQQYKWRGDRKNWLRSGQRWRRLIGRTIDEPDKADERDDGWTKRNL